MGEERCDKKAVVRIAGGFIAWIIGSGFATGQEVLQFFSSYGYLSYAVAALNFVGFLLMGYFLMRTGFEHKLDKDFNHFHYFCGKKLGTFYIWLITATLLLLMPVLISGAGATLNEYYGINKYIASACMAGLVLAAYLIGFEKLVKIVSSIGPVIIAFSFIVGFITILTDSGRFIDIPEYARGLSAYRTAPSWILSGVLYLGLNFFPGSKYYTQLGMSASSGKELKRGVISGAVALILSITIMSTAILLNGNATAGLDIPVLYLARKISYGLGAVFSITLILGIFSSCSAMMWSVCSQFKAGEKKGNVIFAIGIAALSYVLSLFSFGRLVGVFYPLVGYIGLIFIVRVIYKGFKRK